MKRALLALSALCLAAPLAHATVDRRVFDVGPRTVPAEAMRAVEALIQSCSNRDMGRFGPIPDAEARCGAAMARIRRQGPAAARAAMVRIERSPKRTDDFQLFNVIRRVGDANTIATLVRALTRAERRRAGDWSFIADIKDTLAHLVQLDDPLPDAAAWREWLADNRGRSPADFLAERVAAERAFIQAELAQPSITNPSKLFDAAHYLIDREQAPADARAALTALLASGELTPKDQELARTYLGILPAEAPAAGPQTAGIPHS